MRNFDFSPLYRYIIGVDGLEGSLEAPGYPPYNVELVQENRYRITMAVAGFDRSELDIESERNTLKVVGHRRREDGKRTYLHQGLAERDFEHRFRLADHVKVVGASLDNGLLNIDLEREIPEALKPRKIEIGANGNVRMIETQSVPTAQAA